MHNTHSTCIWN